MDRLYKYDRMTVADAYRRMAHQLKIGPNGEVCLDLYKRGDDGFFGQDWLLARAIRENRTSIRFDDVVQYLGHNAFMVVPNGRCEKTASERSKSA